jgi:hypothetical protein
MSEVAVPFSFYPTERLIGCVIRSAQRHQMPMMTRQSAQDIIMKSLYGLLHVTAAGALENEPGKVQRFMLTTADNTLVPNVLDALCLKIGCAEEEKSRFSRELSDVFIKLARSRKEISSRIKLELDDGVVFVALRNVLNEHPH